MNATANRIASFYACALAVAEINRAKRLVPLVVQILNKHTQAMKSASAAMGALADFAQAFKKDLPSMEAKELAALENDFYEGR